MLELIPRKAIAAAQVLSFVCCFVIGGLILKFIGTAQGVEFVLAPSYGASNDRHVAVIHIDSHTVDAWRKKFGGEMSPAALVQLLRTVADLQPRAIYLDVQLLSDKYRSVLQEAEKISQDPTGSGDAQNRSIDIFFARKVDKVPPASDIRLEPRHAVNSSDHVYAENSYRLWPVNELGVESPSPAVRLAQAYCPGCQEKFERPDGSSMAIRWPAQVMDGARGCLTVDRPRLAEFWERLIWLAGGLGEIRKPPAGNCPPFVAHSAIDLMEATGDGLKGLRDEMRERVVIIGESAKPVLLTPPGYEVSRPWIHAAAYENLLTSGHAYWRPPDHLLRVLVMAVLLSAVLMFCAARLSSIVVIKFWHPVLTRLALALLIAAGTLAYLSILRWPIGDRLSWVVAAVGSFSAFIRFKWLRETVVPRSSPAIVLILLIGSFVILHPAYAENDSDEASAGVDIPVRLIGFRQAKNILLEKADRSTVKLDDVFCSLRKDEDGIVAIQAASGLEFRVFATDVKGGQDIEYSVRPLDVILHKSVCIADSAGPETRPEINGNRACYPTGRSSESRPPIFHKKCS